MRFNPKPEDDSLHHYRRKTGNGRAIDDGVDTLHLVIGRAITAWSGIEDDIFVCYLIASNPGNVAAFTAAYNTIQQPRNKIEICYAAMIFYLIDKDDLVAEWEDIYRRSISCLKIRNQIAHFLPAHIGGMEYPVLKPSIYKVSNLTEIVINNEDHKNVRLKDREDSRLTRLTISDIDGDVKHFRQLHSDLLKFTDKIRPSEGLKIAHNLDYI